MGKRKALDHARTASLRAYLRLVIAEDYEGVVSAAARALSVSQPALSDLLSGKKGAGLSVIDAIAHLRHVSIDVVLGRAAAPTDKYPNKAPVMASVEFAAAPDSVREMFVNLKSSDGDKSVVGWSWSLLQLMNAESVGVLRSRGGTRVDEELSDHPADNVIPLLPRKT